MNLRSNRMHVFGVLFLFFNLFLPFTVLPSSAQDATSGNLAIVLFGSDNATLGYARYEGTDNAGVPFAAYDDDGDGVAIAEGLATGQATAYQT